MRRERRVQAELPERAPVTADIGDDRAGDGVGHDRARRARLAVIADEHHSINVRGQARHHAPGLGGAAQELGPPVKQLGQEVPELGVRLGDQHLRARVIGVHAADRGVGFRREQGAVAFVLRMAGPDVIDVHHPGDALHVDRDQHPHPSHPFPCRAVSSGRCVSTHRRLAGHPVTVLRGPSIGS